MIAEDRKQGLTPHSTKSLRGGSQTLATNRREHASAIGNPGQASARAPVDFAKRGIPHEFMIMDRSQSALIVNMGFRF